MKRSCPICNRIILYSSEIYLKRAIKRNSKCFSCAKSGSNHPLYKKHRSVETKQKIREKMITNNQNKRIDVRKKMSESKMGEKHPFYGKKRPDHSERMRGERNPMYGKHHSEEAKRKNSEWHKGWLSGEKHPTKKSEIKLKLRLSAIKRIKKQRGQIQPNYNPKGCKLIDEYGKQHGYNFRHAENGGEVCIGGYFPDGCDIEQMTLVEIDETHHYDIRGNLKQKDVEKQKYLESLGYKIIRIKV